MKPLPSAQLYEEELRFMPYRDSLAWVESLVSPHTPINGTLLDLMCGPGYLLGRIKQVRKDISAIGVDIDERYVDYGNRKYPGIRFEVGDVEKWQPKGQHDLVLCTGALHHIPYDNQERLLERIPSMMKPDGFFILSDCYVDDYSNESERKLAAAKLGYEYLRETIKNGAPKEVIQTLIDILQNDVMMDEFKTSIVKRLPILRKIFTNVHLRKVWPIDERSEYGDYIAICRRGK